jgi:hypothetical protein
LSSTPTPPPALEDPKPSEYTKRIIRRRVWKRCNVDNKHFMGCIVGREGSGKSHTALKIARAVDPTFDAERVFFDPSRLLETLRSDKYGAGTAVVIDEAGVGLGSRTWYDKDQILLNKALQTARDDNMCVLFTLPRLSELDSQTRGRLHAFIEMMELNKRQGYATARWLKLSPARDESGDLFKKYPRLDEHGRTKKIERVRFLPIRDDLESRYEERKAEFKDELYEEAIEAAEASDEDEEVDPSEVAKQIANEGVEDVLSENGNTGQPYINKDLIRVQFDLSHSDASAVKSLLEQTLSKEDLEGSK